MAAMPGRCEIIRLDGFCGLERFVGRLSILLLCCVNLSAIDPHQPITQMHHTAWSAKEGVIGEVLAIAQTTDGFIWVGTTGGLLRFDGTEFERYKPEAGSFPEPSWVSALLATPDGGLWIGSLSGGASFLERGRITNFGEAEGMPAGRVRGFAKDSDGTVWAATASGLRYFDGRRWRLVDRNASPSGLPSNSPSSVSVNREGLWVADSKLGVFLLTGGAREFQQVTSQPTAGYLPTFTDSGGESIRIWVPESLSLLRFPARGQAAERPSRGIVNSAGMFLVDRDGSEWMMTRGEGVWRVPFANHLTGRISPNDPLIERFSEKEGLTSTIVYCAMEDREGDIWVGTLGGLDRFRPRNAAFTELQPIATDRMQLVAGDRGEVWASSPRGLWDARSGKEVRGSPPNIHFSFRDPAGPVWLWSEQGNSGDLWRWEGGQFQKAMSPSRWNSNLAADVWVPAKGPVRALTRDDAGDLWISIRGGGVFRLHNGEWHRIEILRDALEMTAYGAICDNQGRIWLAYPERREVGLWDHGAIRVFSAEAGLDIGAVTQIAYADGNIWAGGEYGLAVYTEGRFHTVVPAGAAEFGLIAGIAGSPESGLWLSTTIEIIHIPQSEVSHVLRDWRYKVQYERFDPVSDLAERPSATSDTPAVIGTDGMIWFATPRGVIRVDPAHLHRNPAPPQIAIRSVVANGSSHSVYSPVTLSPNTTNLRIGYSVLSFPIPERVRSRYRLLGSDPEWRDGGNRVDVLYHRLGPGTYTFQVMACNNDGIWNDAESSLNFTIQPAFYQTFWFKCLYTLVGIALLWAIYRFRLRKIAAAMSARFDERLAERTRIARDFHDTLLQTIQGSKMVAEDALAEGADLAHMKRAMVLLAGWLGQAIQEGREALSTLRSFTSEDDDLSAALRRAGDESRLLRPIDFGLSVEGSSKRMHPIVRDEVYRIGYEAIRNACTHSGATRLDVRISYQHDFVLEVQDNGKGFEPSAVSPETRQEHFGLVGMYERAARIRGKLTISSSPRGGTRVELIIPRSFVFPGQKPLVTLAKWKRLWG